MQTPRSCLISICARIVSADLQTIHPPLPSWPSSSENKGGYSLILGRPGVCYCGVDDGPPQSKIVQLPRLHDLGSGSPKPVKLLDRVGESRLVGEQAKLFGARFSFLLDCSYLFAFLLKGGRSL